MQKSSRKISWVFPILALALIVALALASAGQANAHKDPGGCDNNAVGISIKVFRSDGTTVIKGSHTVIDDEDIKYQATLIHQGMIGACAFEDGDWDIVTPDGVSHNVLPGGGPLPQVGGVSGVPTVKSEFVDYKVTHAHEVQVGGKSVIKAASNYGEDAGLGAGDNGICHNKGGNTADCAQAGITTQTTVDHLEPGITIIKTAGSAADGAVLEISAGDFVTFDYLVTNTGDVDLINIEVTDDAGTPGDPSDDFTTTVPNLAAGASTTVASVPQQIGDPPTCGSILVNIATVEGQAPNGAIVTDDDDAALCEPQDGGEGCTPGFWRQVQHFGAWTDPPYDPESTTFFEAFDRLIEVRTGGRSFKSDPTMLQAVQAVGGGINALARHGVAALLNAADADVDYAFSVDQVIGMVRAAIDSGDYEFTKNILADQNELGCPVNGKGG